MKSTSKLCSLLASLLVICVLAGSSVLSVPGHIAASAAKAPKTRNEHLNRIAPANVNPGGAKELMRGLPLQFEPNEGQAESRFNFLSRGPGYSVQFNSAEAVFALQTRMNESLPNSTRQTNSLQQVTMRLVNANPAAAGKGKHALPGRVNYFSGIDPRRFHTNIRTYERIRYAAVYPGIDVVYYGKQQQLEHDFIVAPKANADQIAIRFDDADLIKLNSAGDVVVSAGASTLSLKKPFAYQMVNGERRVVASNYRLSNDNSIGFELGQYDRERELVIDPVLFYSSFLGGSGAESANDIALDPAGNIYITGGTTSAQFPRTDGSQNKGSFDVFITKLNPSGTALIFSTLLAASGNDSGLSIGLDANRNVYVSGLTDSADFPLTAGAFQTTHSNQDAFAAKLNSTGSALLYSTLLGGSPRINNGARMAVDQVGDMYLTGSTYSDNFPTTSNAFRQTVNPFTGSNFLSSTDSFVAKIHPAGAGAADLVYSTYLGGNYGDETSRITLDSAGFVYVTGYTQSTNFPTTPDALQPFPTSIDSSRNDADIGDAFLVKMDLSQSGAASMIYSTYIGGTGRDIARGVALDPQKNVYLTGRTDSGNFPVSATALQSHGAGGTDVYVMKLNISRPGSSGLIYSTYLGGSADEDQFGGGIAVDSVGNAFVVGDTRSTNLPVTVGAFQPSNGGNSDVFSAPGGDAFAAKLNSAGTALVYFTYLGGSGGDNANAIKLDTRGNAYLAGYTFSPNFPLSSNALQNIQAGQFDAFVACIDVPSSFGHSGIPAVQKDNFDTVADALPNPIDDSQKFVRQQYIDFLNREPDASGWSFWTNEITGCGSDPACVSIKRINVSAAFFLSIEFQQTGYLVYRTYLGAFARTPRLNEFSPDTRLIRDSVIVNSPGWEQALENNTQAFMLAFVQRPDFVVAFPASLTGDQFVSQLDLNAGGVLSPSEKSQLVSMLGATPSDPAKRALVLRALASDETLRDREFNKAFVLMQYYGYLQRNPDDPPDTDDSGYTFWLGKLDQFNGNFVNAEMVNAFISSGEYRTRFGQN